MRSREEKEFLSEMHKKQLSDQRTGEIIRSSLAAVLGEKAAVAALSYTGDGGGYIEGFARRAKELFGEGATGIFEKITIRTNGGNPGPPSGMLLPPSKQAKSISILLYSQYVIHGSWDRQYLSSRSS